MPSIRRYVKALKDYFTTGETGDAAFGEIKFYGIGLNPFLMAQLQDFVGYYSKIDPEKLAQLPEGTLGYEYARHMMSNSLQIKQVPP